jgi:hypothetical protein
VLSKAIWKHVVIIEVSLSVKLCQSGSKTLASDYRGLSSMKYILYGELEVYRKNIFNILQVQVEAL